MTDAKVYVCPDHGSHAEIRCCPKAVPYLLHDGPVPPVGSLFLFPNGVEWMPRHSPAESLASRLAEQFGEHPPRLFHDGP